MMSRKVKLGRGASVEEIERRLQNAGDFLGAMIKHRDAAIYAATGATQDLNAIKDAGRLLARDLQAFCAAMRTAWNYMTGVARRANCEDWLDERLGQDALCRFHRELANQDTHAHEIVFGVNQRLRFEASGEVPIVETGVGRLPLEMKITAFDGVSYHYNKNELEAEAAKFYALVEAEYANAEVVTLAIRYFGKLQSALKNATRRGRFSTVDEIKSRPAI